MTQFTTELFNFLAQKQDIDEFFRSTLETAMNDLLQAELSAFLGYEPYEKVGYNSGNSLNGTYLPLRRGTVSKECILIALGVTPEGQKTVLGYEIAPNENNASWSTLLDKLQNQGIQQVSLVVTDGFKGLEQIISQAHPLAKQQCCLIHISRNLASKVKRADRAVILGQFKMIYRAENLEMAVQALEDFLAEWKPKYRKVMESLEKTDNLLSFYQFPYQIWHSMYSTNLIESLNKEIKHQTKKKVLFPNEEALERYLVTLFEDYNFKQSQRIHKGFGQCSDTLESLFD